ncbi:MAG TPA: hypothetical protein VLW85_09950, partial [Myxococcales bacterium]|nr:hypothetical protein [Myxococcales bacterium]
MSVTLALAALAALLATAAAAEPFPSRLGTSGLLDVEDASVLGPGGTALGVELRLDHAPGVERALGPSPVTVGFGLGYGVEAALALREGGLPGDPRPSPLLFAGAVKLQIFAGEGYTPSVAVQASVDRVNLQAQGAADLVVSAGNGGLLRLAALAGVEDRDELGFGPMGPRGGGAVAVRGPARTELVVQALAHPGGAVFGGALRWAMSEQGGLALAAQWQPGDSGLRVSLGFGFSTAGRAAARKAAAKEELAPAPAVQAGAPAAPVFHDALPRLRLKVKRGEVPGDDDGRHLQPAPPEAAPDAPASPSKQDKTENGQRPRTAGPRRTIAARAHAAPPRKIAVAELVLAPPPPPPPPP